MRAMLVSRPVTQRPPSPQNSGLRTEDHQATDPRAHALASPRDLWPQHDLVGHHHRSRGPHAIQIQVGLLPVCSGPVALIAIITIRGANEMAGNPHFDLFKLEDYHDELRTA